MYQNISDDIDEKLQQEKQGGILQRMISAVVTPFTDFVRRLTSTPSSTPRGKGGSITKKHYRKHYNTRKKNKKQYRKRTRYNKKYVAKYSRKR